MEISENTKYYVSALEDKFNKRMNKELRIIAKELNES